MPGGIHTSLGRHMTDDIRKRLGFDPAQASQYRWKSVEQGSATTIWAALGRELEGAGGLYLEDCNEAVPSEEGMRVGVKPWAQDPQAAARLWTWTEAAIAARSEEHTSELQSLMRTSYAAFCWKTQNITGMKK